MLQEVDTSNKKLKHPMNSKDTIKNQSIVIGNNGIAKFSQLCNYTSIGTYYKNLMKKQEIP